MSSKLKEDLVEIRGNIQKGRKITFGCDGGLDRKLGQVKEDLEDIKYTS